MGRQYPDPQQREDYAGFVCVFYNEAAAIYCETGLTIELIGENTVSGPIGNNTNEIYSSFGIYSSDGNITITGDGVLNVTGGTVTNIDNSAYSYGISAVGVTISGGEVTASGGTATSSEGDAESYGINSYDKFAVSNGTVTATGGAVTATSSESDAESYGIYVGDGVLNVTGGEVTAPAARRNPQAWTATPPATASIPMTKLP